MYIFSRRRKDKSSENPTSKQSTKSVQDAEYDYIEAQKSTGHSSRAESDVDYMDIEDKRYSRTDQNRHQFPNQTPHIGYENMKGNNRDRGYVNRPDDYEKLGNRQIAEHSNYTGLVN